MRFSDRDMMVATQVAYYDFDIDILESNHYNATLRELFEQDPGIYKKLKAELEKEGKSEAEWHRAQSAMNLYYEIRNEESPYGDWVVKAVKDDNNNSGFYGCVIETSRDKAILGFRGSESMSSDQMTKDWALADFGLLNSEQTWQQKVAEEFMREVDEKYDYDYYFTTGHSLGGNLSNHAAITAPESMREKIVQSYSFDGPGFSNEYLDKNKDKIQDCEGKLTHYTWSLVGSLLYQPSVTRDKTVALQKTAAEESWNYFLQRHDVSFVDFDEEGNVKAGKNDIPENVSSALSKNLESQGYGVPFIGPISRLLNHWNEKGKKGNTSKLSGGEQGTTGDLSFSADCFQLKQLFEKLETYKNRILGIALEVSEIRQGLSFGSFQYNIRAELKRDERELELTGQKMEKMGRAGKEVCGRYENTENRVISIYQEVRGQ